MYGMVNKALHGLISRRFGDTVWQEIRKRAGIDVEYFVSMDSYDDAISYRLVGAASELLKIPADELLREFGRHWILYTAQEGYGELLQVCGSKFQEFLLNLDSLHARIGVSFPKLRPPSFRCSDCTDNSVVLHYYTTRPGLAPMVVGLLEGLGERLQTEVEVQILASRESGADHDQFLIRHRPRQEE